MEKNYKEILPKITTFVFDVDGVLTNGIVHISTSGELTRQMHTKDGYALKTAVDQGYNVCIISGGNNEGVRERLSSLGVKSIYLGAHNKLVQFNEYLNSHNINPENVLYMGDDIPDYPVMKLVG